MDLAPSQTTTAHSSPDYNNALLGLVAHSARGVYTCRAVDSLVYWLSPPAGHAVTAVSRRQGCLGGLPKGTNMLLHTHCITSQRAADQTPLYEAAHIARRAVEDVIGPRSRT